MLFSVFLVNGWITCTHYGWGTQTCVMWVVAHMIWKYTEYVCHLTQSCKGHSLLGTFQWRSLYMFWRMYTLKSKTIIRERIKCNIVSVSKSVTWYKKYVHIKTCLATGCLYTEPGGRTGMHYTCTWQGQLTWPGISRKNHWSMSPIPTKICLQTKKSTESKINHVITHIQESVENRKLQLSFPRYWGSFL